MPRTSSNVRRTSWAVGLATVAVTIAGGCGSGAKPGAIAFSARAPAGGRHVYLVDPDGTGLRRLTSVDGDAEPSWAPDGKRLVFKRWKRAGCTRPYHDCSRLWVVGADGGGLRPLTAPTHRSEEPAWSPQGDRIAFMRWADDANPFANQTHLYEIDADGGGERTLTAAPGRDENPTWSPDGEQIAFLSDRHGNYDVYVVPAAGGRVRRLTRTVDPEFAPAWSPDGKRIAFQDASSEIVVVDVDATHRRVVARTHGADGEPAWSPDGKQLAFLRKSGDRTELYVVRADGTHLRRVSIGGLLAPTDPDWGRAG